MKLFTRKRRKADNPEYLAWLRQWPCFVCLKQHCESKGLSLIEVAESPDARRYFYDARSVFDCGTTEAAHVGTHGMAKRCPDAEAMPLGIKHHAHPTAGGNHDSHHAGTRVFWSKRGIDREEAWELLRRLYRAETGKEV